MALEIISSERNRDLELARAAATGDRKAMQDLALRLYERVRTTVFYLAGGHRDADDMVQTAMVEVLRSLSAYEGRSKLERWADRIAVRTVMRRLKNRRWKDRVVQLHEDPGGDRPADHEEKIARRAVRRRLAVLLGQVSDAHREVLTLHWVFGYKVVEIAETLGVPANTVRDRLRRAKKKFKRLATADPVLMDWVEREGP